MAGRSRRQVCRASSGATADFYFTDFAPWQTFSVQIEKWTGGGKSTLIRGDSFLTVDDTFRPEGGRFGGCII